MLNMAELIFFEQMRENGILQTSIFKYVLDLDTYELTAVDEYLSYDDSILDIKERKSRKFIENSSKLIILNKNPQIPEFFPEGVKTLNLCEIHGSMDIKTIGKLYSVFAEDEFLENCLNYNLLNIAVFTEMLKTYEKMQVFKCFLGD